MRTEIGGDVGKAGSIYFELNGFGNSAFLAVVGAKS